MAERLQSYDERGPVIYIGPVQMWLMHDPLGLGIEERHDFTLDLWQLWETESQFTARAGDTIIKRGNTFNDYFGFGTSRDEATQEAAAFHAKVAGAALDVTVETKLIAKPRAHDKKTPVFYNRCVRLFSLPQYRWKMREGMSIHEVYGSQTAFTIWRNGEPTEDAAKLQAQIDEVAANDGAAHIRKGET